MAKLPRPVFLLIYLTYPSVCNVHSPSQIELISETDVQVTRNSEKTELHSYVSGGQTSNVYEQGFSNTAPPEERVASSSTVAKFAEYPYMHVSINTVATSSALTTVSSNTALSLPTHAHVSMNTSPRSYTYTRPAPSKKGIRPEVRPPTSMASKQPTTQK